MALGLAWLGSAIGTGVVGWLVDGLPGGLLVGAAVLAAVALGAVVSNRGRRLTLAFSWLAAVIVIVAGAAATLAAITGDLDAAKVVAVGAVPATGGLLTHQLTRRAQRMSAPSG